MTEVRTEDRVAVERPYFIAVPINQEWFNEAVAAIKLQCLEVDYFRSSFNIAATPEYRIRHSSLEAWEVNIHSHWAELIETDAWITTPDKRIIFQCDFRRGWVGLEIETESEKQSQDIHDQLRDKMGLKLTSPNPYRYRKTSGTYEIKWNREKFAYAVENVMKNIGGGDLPLNKLAIREAYATEIDSDDIEILHPFQDVESLLIFVRDPDKKYRTVRLGVEVPLGVGVGINVNDDHDRLELRSTLPLGKFDDIVSSFRKPLGLKAVKGTHTGSGIAEGTANTKEKWWNKNAGSLLVALIGILSLSGIFGLYRAIYPTYELKITRPTLQGTATEVNGKEMEIDWYLKPKELSFREINYYSRATIRVFKDGSLFTELKGQTPKTKLSLSSGKYEILVQPEGTSVEPNMITVIVIEQRDTSAPR